MDIYQLEYAANMFFKMCATHPEVCPHDLEWCSSNYKERKHYYRCRLCGQEKTEEISEQEVLDYCKRWDYNPITFEKINKEKSNK